MRSVNSWAITNWKNVGFGIAYGRGANALVRQAKTEGIVATQAEMQMLIDNFFEKFPRVKTYIDKCHAAVLDPGYVESAYGRRRYFFASDDSGKLKAQQREAQNMPIQGTVGDALSVALYNIYLHRQLTGMKYKMILPVHDAIFLDVPVDEVYNVVKEVLPDCMTNGVCIPNTKLNLGIDITIMRRWGEKISPEDAINEANEELKLKCNNGVR